MGKKTNLSRIITKFAIFFILIILISSNLFFVNADEKANNDKISFCIKFSQPNLKDINLINRTFTQISIENCLSHGQPGNPSLPVYPIKILLPQNKKVKDLGLINSDSEKLEYNLEDKPIFPQQNPISIGLDDENLTFLINDSAYNSTDPVINYPFSDQYVSYCRGYKILTLTLNPVQYIPSKGEILYYPEMNLDIKLENDDNINPFFRDNLEDSQWVEKLVLNPQETNTYSSANFANNFEYTNGLCNSSEEYQYVIITTTQNGLDDWQTDSSTPYNWTSLMNYHSTYNGYSCRLVTIENISNCSDYWNQNSLFNDTPAKIREFCKDAYQDWNTQYILIGGDDEIIPARELYYSYEGNIDSDLYWSNLDSSFNEDEDSIWGESGDGGFDLYSELYIGRITCDIPQDVSNWLNKSLTYSNSFDKDYLENAGFYGGNSGWSCEGDDFIDFSAIKGTSNWLGPIPGYYGDYPNWLGFLYGFETWNDENPGIGFNLTQKWTEEPANSGWLGGDSSSAVNGLRNAINNDNITLLSGIAHADEDMSLSISKSSWESSYHNTKPFFIYDYGCHCGDMDAADDGILHTMLFHSDTELAFACIYNTGYGWGAFYDTNSSSSLLQKLFWDYLLDIENNSMDSDNWQLGKAHAFSKDAMAPTLNWSRADQWRGIIEGCLLFGDPAQNLKIPYNLTQYNEIPVNRTNLLSIGNRTLQISVFDSDDDQLDISFKTNATGSWENIGSNNSVSSGTYSQEYNFTEYQTTYWWSVNVSDTTGESGWLNETYKFSTRPIHNVTPPQSFDSIKINKTTINLTWAKGENTTHTYIERNTTYPWPKGEGIQVYNNTGTNYSNNTLSPNTIYYYQAWSWDSQDKTWSITNSSSYNNTNNSLPIIQNQTPINESINQALNLNLTVNVTDADNEEMNISFYTNKTGTWEQIGYNSSSLNGTYLQINISFPNYYTKYWWSVNITDSTNWTNATYYFTTVDNLIPQLSGFSPSNASTSVSISQSSISLTSTDIEGDLFNWSIQTNPNIGNNTGNNCSSGSIICNISNLSYSTRYNWNLSIIDQGNATWVNNSYWFRTQDEPTNDNPVPSGGSPGYIILNSAPDTPSSPNGAINGYVDTSYTFTTQTNDTNEDQIRYFIDWGDGTNSSWSDLIESGDIFSSSHIWTDSGTYIIKSKAKDIAGLESQWSENHSINIFDLSNQPNNDTENNTDENDDIIEKPNNIKSNQTFNFSIGNISGYDEINLTYQWDFGDGNISNQKNPDYKYSKPGTYLVNVKIYDQNGTLVKQESFEIIITDESQSSSQDVNEKDDEDTDNNILLIIPIIGGVLFFIFFYKRQLFSYFNNGNNYPNKSKSKEFSNIKQTKYDNFNVSSNKPKQYYFKSTKKSKENNLRKQNKDIEFIRDFIDNLHKKK